MNNTSENNLLPTREYGQTGRPAVLVLHGGPGAPGYMAPVAKRLAGDFRVIEPFQRKGERNTPVTVARHIADLDAVVESFCPHEKPALVGHSWGAMLALAWAAEHSRRSRLLVLIGCGTFDAASRRRMNAIRRQRMTRHVFRRMQERMEAIDEADERLKLQGKLMMQVDSYQLAHVDDEVVFYDALGHEQTWRDMLRLLDEGVYLSAFETIRQPVLMLHGKEDPHPGSMIRDNLKKYLPQLEYHAWGRCGHYPWLERAVCEDFYAVLHHRLLRMQTSG